MTILYITQLLAAIYDALKPHALYHLAMRECELDHERHSSPSSSKSSVTRPRPDATVSPAL